MASESSWQIKKVSEDFCDYSRDDYDYFNLEQFSENFKPSPPISVAEYKARTVEILPRGLFDDGVVQGMLINSKDIRYCEDFDEKYPFPHISNNSGQTNEPFDFIDAPNDKKQKESEAIPQNQGSTKNENVKNPGNSKKKKKKFKKFELSDDVQTGSVYKVPFVPDFGGTVQKNGFPPL